MHLVICFFDCKREKNSVVASQRRLERKLKELNMTLDEERQTHTEQKDQVFAPVLIWISTSDQEKTPKHSPLILFCSSF